MIYKNSLDGITSGMLQGFFVDWPNPPAPDTHLRLLKQSSKVILAVDETANRVVGFITAISDGILSAYIPLLEVLPAYKNKGIGKELVTRMRTELDDIYMIDLCCDDDLVPYYDQFRMRKTNGMILRNYNRQSGS
ncbi:GNAT family N-acetyltransferase [Paenibacillus thiaminolyticus]|uniref:GNAT family N-acetyltransferase n=1 Tax=Paenibacillus thiaminolyticus TaxID=49283 RepID=A0AAP9DZY6_PANTH|nr:GNAT family N-acetyltransferase [Paenibacillus thiaminolyticus]MCY9537163.1 GNAT family N-acetyltransferase [Paenibacillus thiaminolyticus]MCY9600470.1 GNAT family N-acetyltransferase [Paenibacillus thiaminolyticus]MCY9606411.1 GNAT family N-acetyltransferase [Paenibacillus thiaminolyticus]MCY9612914.1 GNAT family N-acetyltransferase [Paenibacillus thiaminolyticus]MCY9621958.1 GNAT family N-acetyltransferase [Paenibacillus thiaminolyticus]